MKVNIRRLAEQAMRDSIGVQVKDARMVSGVFADLIIGAIQRGEDIAIPEIGKLIVKTYPPRRIYCPLRKTVILHRKFKAVRFLQFTRSKLHAEKYGV